MRFDKFFCVAVTGGLTEDRRSRGSGTPAKLQGFAQTEGDHVLNIGGLAGVSDRSYDILEPVKWPLPAGVSTCKRPGPKFADGRFFTDDGRARFVETRFRNSESFTSGNYPFVLNTGRVRDHWHTMTRTARSPRLSAHIAEPFCEIHPEDAARLGIGPADLVEVASGHGRAILRAAITERQRVGSVFAPMHWTDRYASLGRIDALVAPETDPVSGQPGSKHTPVSLRPYRAAWYGYAVLRDAPAGIDTGYWALARCGGGWRVELAGIDQPADWRRFARELFGIEEEDDSRMLAYRDGHSGQHRFAAFEGESLRGALFVGREPVAVSRVWMADRLAEPTTDPVARLRLLAGRGGQDMPDPGAIVFSCFAVGVNQITDAVLNGGCATVDAVGAMLNAGTNCGSCRAEIQKLIHDTDLREEADRHAKAS